MRDTFLIALYAFAGAAATGLAGAGALRLLRRRSLTASLTVVAAVGVVAMLAGTLAPRPTARSRSLPSARPTAWSCP